MKILVYRWDIYPYEDIIKTFKKQGHLVDVLAFPLSNQINDENFTKIFLEQLEKHYDLVFSVNYFAAIGSLCANQKIPYAAWTCDAPLLAMLHPSIFSPTNYIFTFDKKDYETLLQKGVSHLYYLPLSGMILDDTYDIKNSLCDDTFYHYDISFVGNLYDKNRYDEMCATLPDYLCGYMDAAIEAQKNVSGGNVLVPMLDDAILADLAQYTEVVNGSSSFDELRLHFATTVLSYKVTADIRNQTLNTLARSNNVHLFTTSMGERLVNKVNIHPPVDYHTEMPKVFRHSKINLNLTIPNIENGIPLRVFDILAAGGFLLTDYRTEICTQFENGKDLVVFDGIEDLEYKAAYYLTHPEERMQIAKNGQRKVQHLHQYSQRLEKILHTIFPNDKNTVL